jgi:Tol biopolymer transport system component
MGRAGTIAVMLVVSLAAGCGSSDSGKDEYILNPTALMFARLTENPGDDTYPAWNSAGTHLAVLSPRAGYRAVWTLAVNNLSTAQVTSTRTATLSRPSWSPDGASLVVAGDFAGGGASADSWVWVVSYITTLPQLEARTNGAVFDGWPAWSPDGATILLSRGGALWTVPAGGGSVTAFDTGGLSGTLLEPVWSADGERIAFTVYDGQDYDIYVVDAAGGTPTPLVATSANERGPTWSPGGRYIAYESDAAGNWDVWVAAVGGTSRDNLTPSSHDRDVEPAWSPLGEEIVFVSDREGNDDLWLITNLPFSD